jgi:hypothetical protein
MNTNQNLSITIILSLLIHLILYSNFNNIRLNTSSTAVAPIKVQKISPQELEKYRRVGVKTGVKKDVFTAPTPPANNTPYDGVDSKTPSPGQKKLDLKNLSMGQNNNNIRKKSRPLPKPSSEKVVTYRKKREVEMVQQQQQLQQEMYNNLSPGSEVKQLMGRSGLNLKFEPVQGISEDELNSTEKIFFSFQKRTFEKYYLSFVKTFNRFSIEKPLIRKALMDGGHILVGEVRFDREGNIMTIRILKSSPNDDIHELFEETLKSIGQMPNPPDAFIKDKEEFSIFYQLQIR